MTDETVECSVCGRRVAYAKSRLFFVALTSSGSSGTTRTCSKGLQPHDKRAKRAQKEASSGA